MFRHIQHHTKKTKRRHCAEDKRHVSCFRGLFGHHSRTPIDIRMAEGASERTENPEYVDISQYYARSPKDADGFQALSLNSTRPIIVSTSVEANLEIADKATHTTRELLRFGAGNQLVDIINTNGESFTRVKLIRTKKNATVKRTVRYQAGFCGEFGELTFNLLAYQKRNKPVFAVEWDGIDHSFVVIGDRREISDKDIVVADAWTNFPIAHTLNNNLWYQGRDLITKASAPPGVLGDPKYEILLEWVEKSVDARNQEPIEAILNKSDLKVWNINLAATSTTYYSINSTKSGPTRYSFFPKKQIENALEIQREHLALKSQSQDASADGDTISMASLVL